MITNYYTEDIQFNNDPPPTATPSAVGDALSSLFGDDDEATTPWKGTDEKRLDELFKTGAIDEATYRAELKSRKMGDATINDKVKANKPDPNAPKPSTIKPPTMTGSAGLADYSEMSETDIINKVKKGEWTPEQAENVLISSKNYSTGSAKETINAVRPAVKTAEQAASERALETRGITSKLSEADIIKGAELKLWTPDEAYEALVNLKGYSPSEAATYLNLKGWKGGPGGEAPAAKPPIAGSPGELMGQYRNAQGELPASTPGEMMARYARPAPQAAAGGWVVSGAEAANPNTTYTRQSSGLSSVQGPAPMTPRVMTPTVMGRTSARSASSSGGSGKIRAEDGSMVPASFYGKTDMTPIPKEVVAAAKAIEASGRIPPSYVPGQPYPPPGWTGSGLASVAR